MLELVAERRIITGKKVGRLRQDGLLPAVVYGGEKASQSLTLKAREFMKAWKSAGESTILNLKIEGESVKNVLIHEVAVDPVKSNPLHVDFYEVKEGQKLKTHVPLVFVGESEAVKSLGGVLVKVFHEIEVEALPKDLPHELEIDLSKLATFQDHILLKDIKSIAGVTLIGEEESVIVKVDEPRVVEEEETPTDVNLEDIEVEKKGKKEDEDEAGEETAQESGEDK
jgi:large subunit ribosomal protein L25